MRKIIDQIGLTYGLDMVIRPYSDGYVRIEVKNGNKASISDNKSIFSCKEENQERESKRFFSTLRPIYDPKKLC